MLFSHTETLPLFHFTQKLKLFPFALPWCISSADLFWEHQWLEGWGELYLLRSTSARFPLWEVQSTGLLKPGTKNHKGWNWKTKRTISRKIEEWSTQHVEFRHAQLMFRHKVITQSLNTSVPDSMPCTLHRLIYTIIHGLAYISSPLCV